MILGGTMFNQNKYSIILEEFCFIFLVGYTNYIQKGNI